MKILKRITAVIAAVVVAATAGVSGLAADIMQTAQVEKEYYSVTKTVSTPKADVSSGDYEESITVKLTCSTSGARIFYTLDGTTPTARSEEYTEPIRIKVKKGEDIEVVLQAVAMKTGYYNSDIAEYYYGLSIPDEPEIEYMEIKTVPTKTRYKKGDALSLTGGTIIISYADGTYKTLDITTEMISGFNTNTAGTKTVIVTYGDLSDRYTITVTGTVTYDDDTDTETDGLIDIETEDLRARIAGTTIYGWDAITDELAASEKYSDAEIELHNSVYVSKDTLRTAAARKLNLTFVINNDIKWLLDTSQLNVSSIPSIGLGIRTSAVALPQTPINDVGGKEAARFHINSDNRLDAQLYCRLGALHRYKIASLFRYDSESGKLILVDTVSADDAGDVVFTPDKGGDYVIITDNETKIRGDIDNNMQLNAIDASLLMQLIINNDTDNAKCDFDKNGVVNVLDVSKLLRYAVQ